MERGPAVTWLVTEAGKFVHQFWTAPDRSLAIDMTGWLLYIWVPARPFPQVSVNPESRIEENLTGPLVQWRRAK